MKRREFIKTSALGLTVLPTVSLLNQRSAFAAGEEVVALDSPTASALGYVHDATKVDTVKWTKRAGAEGATQLCSNCNFLVGEAKAIAGQEGKWVGCQLFPGKQVNVDGWCNSWTKKA
ncbi:UNVERIFIED_CONTAM: hypothetical protein GTU68_029220 [Idotea baltica]|nr:hypothetical protein [Idotea baltica]